MKANSIFIVFILCLSLASAWPLSFINGTITDLGTNETINGTNVDFVYANNTLFIIPKIIYNFTNVTYQNVTNVTNVTYQNVSYGNFTNYTTQNISWFNYTNCSFNYTYIYNGTGNFTYNKTDIYNKSEIDNRFGNYILTTTANGYVLRTELPNLEAYALKTDINETITQEKTNTTPLWIAIVVVALISIIAILMARGGGEE